MFSKKLGRLELEDMKLYDDDKAILFDEEKEDDDNTKPINSKNDAHRDKEEVRQIAREARMSTIGPRTQVSAPNQGI